MKRRIFLQSIAAASLSPLVARAAAPELPAQYSGADRMQRLVAGAKKEGFLNLYSSAITEHMNVVIAGFQKQYGVKVRLWRGGSEEILQRAVTEARGRRFDLDVVETASPQIIAMGREKLLTPVATPVAAELMRDAIIPGEPWLPARIVLFTGAYNTNAVKKADLPKTYADLANPKWKGKLGIEADDNNWLMALCTALGEQQGLALLQKIVVTNGLSVRKGHTLMANLVASGEVPMGLTIYYHEVEPLKRSGAPIDELNLSPMFAFATGAGVARNAPHPNAAVLFHDYLLTDGQKILADQSNVPANVKYQRLPAGTQLSFFDVPKYMGESAKWTKAYKEILARQVR